MNKIFWNRSIVWSVNNNYEFPFDLFNIHIEETHQTPYKSNHTAEVEYIQYYIMSVQ